MTNLQCENIETLLVICIPALFAVFISLYLSSRPRPQCKCPLCKSQNFQSGMIQKCHDCGFYFEWDNN